MFRTLSALPSNATLRRECLRFGLVGVLGFLVDFSVLMICRDGLGMTCAWAATIGYTVGLLATYLLNVNWVFETRRFDSRSTEFTLFVGIGLMGLGVTQLIFGIGVGVLGFDYRLVKLFAVGWVMVQNFVVRKTLLFSADNSPRSHGAHGGLGEWFFLLPTARGRQQD